MLIVVVDSSFPAYCITASPKPTLPFICSELRSDAILISLFRTGAAPMPCPFKGPLEFTYSHGEGECKSPLSAAETCTQESRLLFRYQACANVLSSESVGEYTSQYIFILSDYILLCIKITRSQKIETYKTMENLHNIEKYTKYCKIRYSS